MTEHETRRALSPRRDYFDDVVALDHEGHWVIVQYHIALARCCGITGWTCGVLGEADRARNAPYYSTASKAWVIRSEPRYLEAIDVRVNYPAIPRSHRKARTWAETGRKAEQHVTA